MKRKFTLLLLIISFGQLYAAPPHSSPYNVLETPTARDSNKIEDTEKAIQCVENTPNNQSISRKKYLLVAGSTILLGAITGTILYVNHHQEGPSHDSLSDKNTTVTSLSSNCCIKNGRCPSFCHNQCRGFCAGPTERPTTPPTTPDPGRTKLCYGIVTPYNIPCETPKPPAPSPGGPPKGPAPAACFPENSQVWTTSTESSISIRDVRPGMEIILSDGSVTNVVDIYHRIVDERFDYLSLRHDGGFIHLSSEHLIYRKTLNGEIGFAKAGTIKPQDQIKYLDQWVDILSIENKNMQGLYGVHTGSGTIEVDGVLCSCYSGINSHDLAHFFYFPNRLKKYFFHEEIQDSTSKSGATLATQVLQDFTRMLVPNL